MLDALAHHWPNYVIEAALLGTFMVVACSTVALVAHPGSPLARRVTRPIARRAMIGVTMGATAVLLITSPWGRLSGAHLNPATTLTFTLLGRVSPVDAAGYALGQFAGAIVGVGLARLARPSVVRHAAVNCAVTQPPAPGARAAWRALLAEIAMTFVLFSVVLRLSNHAATAPYTPYAVGALVASYITLVAPISGMSLNPARTFGSAVNARSFRALWVYFVGPVAGMSAAALVYVLTAGPQRVYCAKLDHSGNQPCIFDCHIEALRRGDDAGAPASALPEGRP